MKVIGRLALSTALALLLWAGTALAQKPIDPKPVLLPEPAPEGSLAKLWAADPKDDEVRKLMKERVKTSDEYLRQLESRLGNIKEEDYQTQISTFMAASKRLTDYVLELANTPDEKVAVLTLQLEQAKGFEKKMKQRSEAGNGPPHFAIGARLQRLDAEIQLLKAKKEFEKPKQK